MLSKAIISFEKFVASLKQDIYFVEPLYYHNAVIFEKYGFTYQKGLRLMERVQNGFSLKGDLVKKLDSSTPFRTVEAQNSVRLRSWAIHDDILGEPFSDVTMYKYVGKSADVRTCRSCTTISAPCAETGSCTTGTCRTKSGCRRNGADCSHARDDRPL